MIIQNLEDNHGAFGDFIISRNVTTQEGCTVCCKYRIHYDFIHNSTSFIGRRNGPKCVRQVRGRYWEVRAGVCEGGMLQETEECPRYYYIDRRQSVTTDFRQHCIRVKHYLYSVNSIQEISFIDKVVNPKTGVERNCHVVKHKTWEGR